MKQITVTNIQYDTDDIEIDLPTTLDIDIPEDLEDEDIQDYLSDEISNRTGFCHFGFTISK